MIMSTPTSARPGDRPSTPADQARSGLARRRGRLAALTAAALTTMAATVMLAPATQAASLAPVPQDVSATAAVTALTSGDAGSAALPADFAEVMGYRPAVVDGLLVNPHGDCSSPVPLPAEFDTACKAHDLGYDLLRYADRQGAPLGPWARQAIDRTLGERMGAACDTRAEAFARGRCHAMAAIADTVVDLNSRRQGYGVPVAESFLGAAAADTSAQPWLFGGAAIAATAVTGAVVLTRARRGVAGPSRPAWAGAPVPAT
ncbi:hypothetical protein [Nocardia cyriacigeorgica]|uniref:hypothetical protein n=1 Tax=Nocardia cyriacigeorgica TaxID=135487 RepID=UPI001895FF61|nr:hypothetical protein [Nocardia cyriacigeorgica]MBF6424005.1 hypothetical protein [Nocardia cyriacigeorgica]BDT88415.1 hypothetical protein FMUAM8_41790 [Nocardia cyriacigeorgica]